MKSGVRMLCVCRDAESPSCSKNEMGCAVCTHEFVTRSECLFCVQPSELCCGSGHRLWTFNVNCFANEDMKEGVSQDIVFPPIPSVCFTKNNL